MSRALDTYQQFLKMMVESNPGLPARESDQWYILLREAATGTSVIDDAKDKRPCIVAAIDEILTTNGVTAKYNVEAQAVPAAFTEEVKDLLVTYNTTSAKEDLYAKAYKLLSRMIAIRIVVEKPADLIQVSKALETGFGEGKQEGDPTEAIKKGAAGYIKQDGKLVNEAGGLVEVVYFARAYLQHFGHIIRIEAATEFVFHDFNLNTAAKTDSTLTEKAKALWKVYEVAKVAMLKCPSGYRRTEGDKEATVMAWKVENAVNRYKRWVAETGVDDANKVEVELKGMLKLWLPSEMEYKMKAILGGGLYTGDNQ